MAKFLSKLDVVEITDMAWELDQDLVYETDIGPLVQIKVPKGFITDFASVPRLPLAYSFFGNKANRPAVIHDYLYQTNMVTRGTADAIFLEAMKVDGQGVITRYAMWAGVRLFGWMCYKQKEQGNEKTDDSDAVRRY